MLTESRSSPSPSTGWGKTRRIRPLGPDCCQAATFLSPRTVERLTCWECYQYLHKIAISIHHPLPLPTSLLGESLFRLEQLESVAKQSLDVVQLSLDMADAHNKLGSILWKVGKQGNALRHFEKALRVNTNYPESHNSRSPPLRCGVNFRRPNRTSTRRSGPSRRSRHLCAPAEQWRRLSQCNPLASQSWL